MSFGIESTPGRAVHFRAKLSSHWMNVIVLISDSVFFFAFQHSFEGFKLLFQLSEESRRKYRERK